MSSHLRGPMWMERCKALRKSQFLHILQNHSTHGRPFNEHWWLWLTSWHNTKDYSLRNRNDLASQPLLLRKWLIEAAASFLNREEAISTLCWWQFDDLLSSLRRSIVERRRKSNAHYFCMLYLLEEKSQERLYHKEIHTGGLLPQSMEFHLKLTSEVKD